MLYLLVQLHSQCNEEERVSTQIVKMKIMELDNYYFIARPCVDIADQKVQELVEKADEHDLDFVCIVYENFGLPEVVTYDKELFLGKDPAYVILVRNIGAGLYSKGFIEKNHLEIGGSDELFPDIYLLWQVFTSAGRAMCVSAAICEKVYRDTVWIDDSQTAFTVNRAYDRIKDMLMTDWEVWQKWKGYYSSQRWACYYELLHWMTEDVGWEFAERMVVEFHRSYENDEIDEKLFSLEERSNFYILAKDPGYVKRFYLGKVILDKRVYDCKNKVNDLEKVVAEKDRMMQAQRESYEQRLAKKQAEHEEMCSRLEQQRLLELEQQKQKYESSVTFKAGRVIMFIPSGIKRLVFRMMKKE